MPKANLPHKGPHILSANLHLPNLLWGIYFCVQGCLFGGGGGGGATGFQLTQAVELTQVLLYSAAQLLK